MSTYSYVDTILIVAKFQFKTGSPDAYATTSARRQRARIDFPDVAAVDINVGAFKQTLSASVRVPGR